MIPDGHWIVDVYISQEDFDRTTHARTQLRRDDGKTAVLEADGYAHRNPRDQQVSAIGAELAAARALAGIVSKLESRIAEDLSQQSTPPAHASAW